MLDWTQRQLGATGIPVGPCAWRIAMLANARTAAHVRDRPSLVVVMPEDDDALLEAAGPNLADLPLMLVVPEPAFARRLESDIRRRTALLGASRLDILSLVVDDPADLKGGGMLQVLFALRERGFCGHLGLAHADARHAEWLAMYTAVRVLMTDYSLAHQQAGYRALDAAADYDMACIALVPPPRDDASLRFALGAPQRMLAVLDRPLPKNLVPMSLSELEASWQEYQMENEEPAALVRAQPPE